MKKRSPVTVWILSIVTCGIYGLVWYFQTANEMNQLGANIPNPILVVVPLVNIWWLWKYCEGAQKVTNNELSGVTVFIMMLICSIGIFMAQGAFNKIATQ